MVALLNWLDYRVEEYEEAKAMSNNYRPTIDEALESVEKLDDMIDMLDYGGALSTDEVDEACMALTTIKLYIQNSVPRAE